MFYSTEFMKAPLRVPHSYRILPVPGGPNRLKTAAVLLRQDLLVLVYKYHTRLDRFPTCTVSYLCKKCLPGGETPVLRDGSKITVSYLATANGSTRFAHPEV
ncbi:unnamed protein product [Tuber aestivum]|uniref:Uncharacterized protein n=1 Tax=Tuber aestivum TaxID=59557 RepID=A0A292PM24_9PEZI|nr:unnamed protein product [Tuber aestivum]